MISLYRLTYNGYSSEDFDLLCDVAFDSDEGESSSYLNREAVASESYNGTFRRIHNYKYSEVFAPRFTFLKNDFSEFTLTEQRRILSWLTSSNTPKFLTAYYDDSEVVSFEILGAPTDISLYKNTNNTTIGIVFTFESSAPYAFSDIKTVTKTITTPQTFTINCESDELDAFVYPKITIVQGNDIVVPVSEPMGDDPEDRPKHIDGTVYSYTNDGSTTYYWIGDGYEVADYTLATSYEEGKTYYIKNNGTTMLASPTADNFDQGTYYVSYIFREDETYYIRNNNEYTVADPQPTGPDGIYYVFSKDKLFTKQNNNSGFNTTSVLIKNNTLSTESIVGKDISGETIILDGANKVVSSNRIHGRIFGDDFNWQWMPLAPGNNSITITGNCTVTIEWREPLKIAEF